MASTDPDIIAEVRYQEQIYELRALQARVTGVGLLLLGSITALVAAVVWQTGTTIEFDRFSTEIESTGWATAALVIGTGAALLMVFYGANMLGATAVSQRVKAEQEDTSARGEAAAGTASRNTATPPADPEIRSGEVPPTTDGPPGPGWWQASDLKWYPPSAKPGGDGSAHDPQL